LHAGAELRPDVGVIALDLKPVDPSRRWRKWLKTVCVA